MIELFSRFCNVEIVWEILWMSDDNIDWECLKIWNEEDWWLSGLQLFDRHSYHLNSILATLNFRYFINQQISSHQDCYDILLSRFSDTSTWYLWCYIEISICDLIIFLINIKIISGTDNVIWSWLLMSIHRILDIINQLWSVGKLVKANSSNRNYQNDKENDIQNWNVTKRENRIVFI
jgi:hypothetical protein